MAALAEQQKDHGVRSASGRLRRVLFVYELEPRKFGSLEEQIAILGAAFQAESGLLLPVFTAPPAKDVGAHYAAAGIQTASVDMRRFHLATLVRLLRLITRHQIEVVHWNLCEPLTNGYVWALSVLKPSVQHYFTDHISRDAACRVGPGRAGMLKRLLLKRYARVMGVSQFVVERIHAQGIWPAAGRLLHFINTDRFAPDVTARSETRRRLGVDESRFVLVSTGYLIRAKGVDTAVRALSLLGEAELWIVGDGMELSALQALSRELGVQQRVRFLGLQSRVEPYMQAADVFVCPSRWAEAAGLVNIEAQACGLPVVASRIEGIPEYVAEGRTGLLFAPDKYEEMARAVRVFMADRDECRAMGQRAREWAVEHFSPAARLKDFLDLYRMQTAPKPPWRNADGQSVDEGA
jgi:glycosyltransferase involved in cell wall biosynthesis